MIYLDNAATSFPKPRSVINAMCSAQCCFGANPGRGGHALSVKAGQLVYDCREKLADHFGCSSENVVFTCNCTAALNTAIKGVLKKGDHVIISSLEHNSVSRPVHALSERGIITYSVATVNPLDDNETLKAFASHINENTRAIITTMFQMSSVRCFLWKSFALFARQGAFFLFLTVHRARAATKSILKKRG